MTVSRGTIRYPTCMPVAYREKPWRIAGFTANDELTVTEVSATGQKVGIRVGMRVAQFQGQTLVPGTITWKDLLAAVQGLPQPWNFVFSEHPVSQRFPVPLAVRFTRCVYGVSYRAVHHCTDPGVYRVHTFSSLGVAWQVPPAQSCQLGGQARAAQRRWVQRQLCQQAVQAP